MPLASGRARVGMRRSPRPSSAASQHKHTPNFYSDNSNSSIGVTSGTAAGTGQLGQGQGTEGRRARSRAAVSPP